MSTATPSASSASAWSGLSLVDNTYNERRGQVVLNNSLGAIHSFDGLDANQQLGDVVDIINRGTSPVLFAAGGTAALAKDRFATPMVVPASSKIRAYYNGLTWEPYTEGAGLLTKIVAFTENATNTVHTGSVILPAGSFLDRIQVINPILWTGGAAVMKVGDTVDDDGFFTGVNLKATDLLVGEVLDTNSSTLWGGKEGAYLVGATGQRGPVTTNFGKYYGAGTTIAGIVTVTTPATAVGRTFMIVTYSPTGGATAAVPSA